jgi:hypothetical protein
MKASFVDLRKKSARIFRALERNETVTVFYRGRPKAIMRPVGSGEKRSGVKASEHAAYGIWAGRDDLKDVAAVVRKLRRGRVNDI